MRLILSFALGLILVSAPRANAADNEVHIGFVVPLTGAEAEQGQQQTNALQLGMKQAEKNGALKGKTIKVISVDNKSTNEGSADAIQKLVSDPTIIAVFGTLKTPQVKAMLPTIHKAGVPTFIGATNSTLTAEGKPWVFRARPTDIIEVKAIIETLKANLKATKVALLHNTDAYGAGAANFFTKLALESGIQVVKRAGTADTKPDLKAVFADFAAAGAQAVIVYSNNVVQCENFVKQFHELKPSFLYIGGPTHIQASVLKNAKAELEGIYVVSSAGWGVSDASKKFQELYRSTYQSEADINNAWPYDLISAVSLAVGDGATDKAKLRAAVTKTKNIDGAMGTVSFDESGEGMREAKLIKVENGKFKIVE